MEKEIRKMRRPNGNGSLYCNIKPPDSLGVQFRFTDE